MSNQDPTIAHDAHQFRLLQALEFFRPSALKELREWRDRWSGVLTSEQAALVKRTIALLDKPLVDY